MNLKSRNGNGMESKANITVFSEPWCNSSTHSSINPMALQGNVFKFSSFEHTVGNQSHTYGEMDMYDNVFGTVSLRPGGNHVQQVEPINLENSNEGLTQPPLLELFAHLNGCASNPYLDPCFRQIIAAYGQPLVPRLNNMQGIMPLMPLISEKALKPVYVNPKQYQAILRRRETRIKEYIKKKLVKGGTKPYLYESLHQHALKRQRGSGGRFARKSDDETSKEKDPASSSASGSTNPSHSMRPSSGIETMPTSK